MWSLVVRGPRERRDDGSWIVKANFANAPAGLTGELEGTLRWDLVTLGYKVGTITSSFELAVANETFELTLSYRRPLVSKGISAKGWLVYRGTGEREQISFSKVAYDEVAWLRTGGPHRIRLGT